ncbi:DUF2855 family protein [Alteromonas sp. ASW11-36]|uniref:DUF2855 family protein n=1 Tax=Alteromonas arenosi TaxID=3055817 RepID=A0ABT7SVQ5_9ALTE|nr:DUF2855 family protein [Alteromonas sp. ASW11-36]MDM7860276.1 DUF2855 family protein [Alteromonas sp. ASW11-36]
MQPIHCTTIEIQKDALVNVRQVETTIHLDENPNAVLLEVEQFGLSANNITYALLGERFGYWGFFPGSKGYGIIPVWGFAKVVESNTSALTVGERVYGYLPMGSHLLVHADKITAAGFSDNHPQRRSISPVYDHYMRCNADPSFSEAAMAWILTFRPLFTTSFVLAYALVDKLSTDKDKVWLTSASSKTAYGTAQILKALKPELTVIGVTSPPQREFVTQSDCYDEVKTYDEASQGGIENADWILDFAGDQKRLIQWRAGHEDASAKTILIGATDIQAQGLREKTSVGHVFFAPDEVRKYNKEWGPETFQKRYAEHWQDFVKHFSTLLHTQQHHGAQAIVQLYQQFLEGNIKPTDMHVLDF